VTLALSPVPLHLKRVEARPFLKWAGGKGQLLPELLARVPIVFGKYFEPFLGGGDVGRGRECQLRGREHEEQDLFGTAVQLAARICAQAEPGQILASDVVQLLAAGKGFVFADQGEVALKGFDKPVRLHEVRWRED